MGWQEALFLVGDTTIEINTSRAYTARASFAFQSRQQPAATVLRGTANLDFYVGNQGQMGSIESAMGGMVNNEAPARGAGLLLTGQWQQAAGSKSFTVGRDVFIVADGLFSDFGVGDRGGEVNPKYVKLGWNDVWANEEWWAEPGKPALSM